MKTHNEINEKQTTNNNETNNKNGYLFYSTTILGLLLIIFNIFLDLKFIVEVSENNESLRWILTVLSKSSSTIGLALILGNLTKLFNKKDERENEEKRHREINGLVDNFEKKIEEKFITGEEVKNEITNLVDVFVNKTKQCFITKEMLCSFSEKEKKEIIAKILTPDNDALNRYSNIRDYFYQKSDKYLNFFNINFRSHMDIDIKITKDKIKQKLKAEYTISYRVYKINEKYERLCIFSEKDFDGIITTLKDSNDKQLKTLEPDELIFENGKYYYEIPEKYSNHNFLIIERQITEYGHPHWISIYWRSLTPIEGIKFTVKCTDGIIKESNIFDNGDLYDKPKINDDRKLLLIKSNQWLDPYTGICVIVAEPSNDDDFESPI